VLAEPLDHLARTAAEHRAIELELRRAVLAARESGASYTAIARALGVSRQAARTYALRCSSEIGTIADPSQRIRT